MEVTLTPEIEALIARKLATGRYRSAEEIVIEALKTSVEKDADRDQALDALRHIFGDSEADASARDWLREKREHWQKG